MLRKDYFTVAQYLAISQRGQPDRACCDMPNRSQLDSAFYDRGYNSVSSQKNQLDPVCCDSGYNSVSHSRQASYDVDGVVNIDADSMEPPYVPSPRPPYNLTPMTPSLPLLTSRLSNMLVTSSEEGRVSPSIYNHTKVGRLSPGQDLGYSTLTSSRLVQSPVPRSSTSIQCPINLLPDQLLLVVFSLLDCRQLSRCSRVCRRWRKLARRPQLWRNISLSGEVDVERFFFQLLHSLAPAPQLEQLSVTSCSRISDSALTAVAPLSSQLQQVRLEGCDSVSGAGVSQLLLSAANLQQVEVVSCGSVGVLQLPPGLQLLQLQSVDLSNCQQLVDAALHSLLSATPALRYLFLRRCSRLTDASIACIPGFCPDLRELSVSDCYLTTDASLRALSRLGHNLRYLSVAKCSRVGDTGVCAIGQRCRRLRYLNVRGCPGVGDAALEMVSQHCSRLQALDVGGCSVSDAGLSFMAVGCPRLAKLSLKNCRLVSEQGIRHVARHCVDLVQLNVQDTQFGVQAYRAVKKYCRRCVIEHTNPGLC